MPEIRYNVLKKTDVHKVIGKAKINSFVFYLIKWKSCLDREISWQSTSLMANMGKNLVHFNEKIKNKSLPYVEKEFRQKGLQLLQSVNEKDEQQKRKWKIQKIIGKRYINGGIHYFMKWKNHSIFQSDWISQHGLWRLYAQQLKQFKIKITIFNLPYLDTQSFEQYIELEQTAFLNEPRFKGISNLISDKKTKKEKLLEKKKIKQEQIIKTQPDARLNQETLSDFVHNLKERFYRPIETLYLKTQYNGVKIEEEEYNDQTTQFQQHSELNETQCEEFSENVKKKKSSITKTLNDHISEFKHKNSLLSKFYQNEIDELILKTKNSVKNESLALSQTIQNGENEASILSREVKFQFQGELSRSFIVDYFPNPKNQELSFVLQSQGKDKIDESIKNQQSLETNETKNTNPSSQSQNQISKQQFKVDQHVLISFSDEEFGQLVESLEQSSQSVEKQQQESEQNHDNIRKIAITKRNKQNYSQKSDQHSIESFQRPSSFDKVTQIGAKEKIISIRLFAQDITSLQNSQQKQNLYEVIFQKPQSQTSKIRHVKSQLSQKPKIEENTKERKFLETSYLKKHHNDEFLEYLEKEVVKLKKQH